MKKLISSLIVICLCLSLCACGTITIGPLDFNFDRSDRGSFSDSSSEITYENATAADAPAADAPAEEIAPMDEIPVVPIEPEGMYSEYGSFSFVMYDVYLGYFSPKGYNRDFATEPTTPYIIVVFDYEELTDFDDPYRTYSEFITIDGAGSFAPVNPNDYDYHFVNSIDRYFGIKNSFEHETLEPGESELMFACYPITEEAAAMVEAGAPIHIRVGESDIEHPFAVPIHLIDEILVVYNNFGYDYETAHAGATLLWSIDFAHDVLNGQFDWCENQGDTGNCGSDLDLVPELYFGGACASPATVPNLDGEFFLNVGAPSFAPELAEIMYPDLAGIMYEYMEVCHWFCDTAAQPGNLDEARDAINMLNELYYVMCEIAGFEPMF